MSLGKKALLVSLSIGFPTVHKLDRKETKVVNTNHHITDAKGVARVTKDLYPRAVIDRLTEFKSAADSYYRKTTVVWPDRGWQLLPAAIYGEFSQKMRAFAYDFAQIKGDWERNYEAYIEEQKRTANGLFNPSDYPHKNRMLERFQFEWKRRPVPESGSYYVDITQEELADVKAEADIAIANAIVEANRELWSRLKEPLERIVENCSKEKVKIYDSLLGNLAEIIDLIPALNLSGDTNLEAFRQMAKAELGKLTTEQLKTSPLAKAEAARKAEMILREMQSFYPA